MDLKFKIIAEAVSAGWDKSKGLIDNLKAKFNSMFDGAKAGWAKIGAAAIAAGTAMYKIGEAWRQSFLSELKTMADALENFVQDSNRNLRKIKFQDTDTEKARNLEDIGKQIRERKKRIEEINASQDTESLFGRAFLDPLEKTGRKITGRGFTEAEEVEREKLQNEVRQLEKQYLLAASKKTKDQASAKGGVSAAFAEIEKQRDTQAAEIAGRAVDQAVEAGVAAVKEAAEKMREATAAYAAKAGDAEAAKAVIDATKALQAAEAARHDAWKAQAEERKKIADKAAQDELDRFNREAERSEAIGRRREELAKLQEGVAESTRAFEYAQATPVEKVGIDKARLGAIEKRMRERDGMDEFVAQPDERAGLLKESLAIKQRLADAEKEARKIVGEAKSKPEPVPVDSVKRMRRLGENLLSGQPNTMMDQRPPRRMGQDARAADEIAKAENARQSEARNANAGRSLLAGDLFTNLYGQNIERGPEQQQADSLKEAVEVLKAIEKKTGAAA